MNEICRVLNLSTSELAAWVQAIGSIAAIFASATIVWWQVRKQHGLDVQEVHRRTLESELRVIEGFADVAVIGGERLLAAANSLATSDSASHYQSSLRPHAGLDLIEKALETTDAGSMTSASLSLAVLSVRRRYRQLMSLLDDATGHRGTGVDALRGMIRTQMSSDLLLLTQDNSIVIDRANYLRECLRLPLRRDNYYGAAGTSESDVDDDTERSHYVDTGVPNN